MWGWGALGGAGRGALAGAGHAGRGALAGAGRCALCTPRRARCAPGPAPGPAPRAARPWPGLRAVLTRWLPLGSAVYVGWCYIRANMHGDVSRAEIKAYELLPLRVTSRLWGRVAACEVPVSLRGLVYGVYVRLFRVNLDEAAVPDLRHYRSLSEFFTRPLKDGARLISPQPCVSPCDGVILNCGPADSDRIEQVKGVTYSLEAFLGQNKWSAADEDYYESLLKNKKNILHQCIIYLAPGDYHRFHSPCDWSADFRRHFSGKLLSVNPWIAKIIPGLFCINERAVYTGEWEHGFFSMTAVGATNVGSIEIFTDKDLQTNMKGKRHEIEEAFFKPCYHYKKGELFGQFNMGSTIVLLFEAPKDFKFDFASGDRVRVGEALSAYSRARRR